MLEGLLFYPREWWATFARASRQLSSAKLKKSVIWHLHFCTGQIGRTHFIRRRAESLGLLSGQPLPFLKVAVSLQHERSSFSQVSPGNLCAMISIKQT